MNPSVKMDEADLMNGRRYFKEDAEDILGLIDSVLREFLKVDEHGIWISHDHPIGLSWVPLLEIDYPGSPNPRTHPALPFPFSAQQLTAFMLDGIGSVIREQLGAWRDGPDEATLSRLPDQATKAAEALRLAFRAYQAAVAVVGEAPYLGDEAPERAHAQWRKQMVSILLKTAAIEHSLIQPDTDQNRSQVVSGGSVKHVAKQRQDQLASVISIARQKAADPTSWISVWDSLVALALSEKPPAPLLGYVVGEGIKYITDVDREPVRFFTREALRKRVDRKMGRAAADAGGC